MKQKESKYRMNKLTHEELNVLRNEINGMTDEQLAVEMRDYWMNGEIDLSNVSDLQIEKIKQQVDAKIKEKDESTVSTVTPPHNNMWRTVMRYAAIFLLPIFILTTYYFYKESTQLTSQEMIVSTGVGERATITLPDGTKVMMNALSKLTYIPKEYNKEERKVHFDGEGYFHVAKDKERPFLIGAQGLQVTVLGTKFNLLARKDEVIAQLSLQEGSVLFASLLTGQNVVLSPNQKAILDKATGRISVETFNDFSEQIAWQRKEMVFHNTPLRTILSALEKNYNVKIHCKGYLTDLFTGTLPIANINEALQILEESYHFDSYMDGKNIYISKSE